MTKPKRVTVAEYIESQIAMSDVSQKDIAAALNYDKPNVITMIKQGKTKLPINKVGPLAKALNVDPVHLLRLAMAEYMPDTWEAIQNLVGKSLVTEGEMQVVQLVREHANGHELVLEKADHRNALARVIREVAAEESKITRKVPVKK
jgi:DNA-binding CsgD family transcriptional regulator